MYLSLELSYFRSTLDLWYKAVVRQQHQCPHYKLNLHLSNFGIFVFVIYTIFMPWLKYINEIYGTFQTRQVGGVHIKFWYLNKTIPRSEKPET
jgi:hypothetical protein